MKHFIEVYLAPILCFMIVAAAGQIFTALVLSLLSSAIGEYMYRRSVSGAKEEIIIPEICDPIQTEKYSGYPEATAIDVQPIKEENRWEESKNLKQVLKGGIQNIGMDHLV